MNKLTGKLTINGMLIALALVLSLVENLIPPIFAVPGMKLGLTNIVVLYALYRLGTVNGLAINIIRIIMVGLMCGNSLSLAYSLSGGILSYAAMLVAKKVGAFKIITVSALGGVFHNLGQIIAAIIIVRTAAVAWYFTALWFSGIIAGLVIGAVCGQIMLRIDKLHKRNI